MKRLEPYILALCIFACALTYDHKAQDIRHLRLLIWAAIATVLFLSLTYRGFKHNNVDFSICRRIIFPAFAGLMIISFISMFWAINKSEAMYQALRYFLTAITVLEAALIKKKPVIKALVLTSIILCVIGIYDNFNIPVISLRGGTMGGKNLQASALALLLPFSAYVFYKFRYHWKFLGLISIVLSIYQIGVLQSRAVYLAVPVMLLTALAARKRLLIGIFAMWAVFAVMWFWGSQEFKTKITDYKSLVNRGQIWSAGLKMLEDNPLGVGAGNWRIGIQKYGKGILPADGGLVNRDIFYTRAHNWLLQTTTEIGYTGLFFFLLMFAAAIFYAYRSGCALAACVIVGFAWISCFSFPDERAFPSLLLAISFGIALAQYHGSREINVKPHELFALSVPALALLGLALVSFCHRYKTENMVYKLTELRTENKFIETGKTLDDFPKYFTQLDPLGLPIYAYKGDWAYASKNLYQALFYYLKAEKQNPYNIYVLNNIGSYYCIMGEHKKAIDYLKRALEISPAYRGAQRNIAYVRRQMNK
jgi:tetratricopeptide (TPR) repeat protein